MTFEEFFHKKKIDLVQLQSAESVLFAEFKSHYNQMGEKSFDHSKKFWFNKLRRLYHIKEEPKPVKASIETNQIASQTEIPGTLQPEIKKGFTPRFKANAIPGTSSQLPEETTIPDKITPEIDSPKPAFKPRFKPQMAKPATILPTNLGDTIPEEKAKTEDQPKPVYKPRFKPQMAKPSEPALEDKSKVEKSESVPLSLPISDTDQTTENSPSEEPKTVFKPKFTPRSFKPKSEE